MRSKKNILDKQNLSAQACERSYSRNERRRRVLPGSFKSQHRQIRAK